VHKLSNLYSYCYKIIIIIIIIIIMIIDNNDDRFV